MKNIANFYQKNQYYIYLFFFLVIASLVIAIIVVNMGNDNFVDDNSNPDNYEETLNIEKIVLFGSKTIELQEGDNYSEPGYYAVTYDGEIKKNEVKVTSNLDINKVGTYLISYSLGDKTVSRTVKILKKETTLPNTEITFTLKGNSLVVLDQGSVYKEEGYEAFDENNQDISDKVLVQGEVNTNMPGTYNISYTLKVNNQEKTLTRQVIVNSTLLDAVIEPDTKDYTSGQITLTIQVTGESFSYLRNPDSTFSSNKISTYQVTKNGTYKFYIYDINDNYLVKEIQVSTIDKDIPTGICNLKYENGRGIISVIAQDNTSKIKEYKYYGNGSLLGTTSSSNYDVSSKLTSAYVVLYDAANNSNRINCNVEKTYDLEVHFIDLGDDEDAILIRDSTKTIFIDGGRYNKGTAITNYLKNLGVTKIDVLIGSHLHYDHIQAQAKLLENFEVSEIYYPQDLNTCYSKYCDKADQKYILSAIKEYKKTIKILKVEDNLQIGDMNIYCIGPIKFQTKSQSKYRQNYNSLNFILTYGNTKFMFTGDGVQYSEILERFPSNILDIDVLKYPHHGNTSLGKKFVNTITPKYVVITSSRDKLSERSEKTYLKNVGAEFYYNYKSGNILITSDGNNLTVKTKVNPSNYKR